MQLILKLVFFGVDESIVSVYMHHRDIGLPPRILTRFSLKDRKFQDLSFQIFSRYFLFQAPHTVWQGSSIQRPVSW